MSELTRDDVLDIMLECDPHVCCSCPLESQKYECYEIKESALNSLRDDYNAEVEKNERLEAEIERLKAVIKAVEDDDCACCKCKYWSEDGELEICQVCDEYYSNFIDSIVMHDYINRTVAEKERLTAELAKVTAELKQVTAERDAAIEYIPKICGNCAYVDEFESLPFDLPHCDSCLMMSGFKWRGLTEQEDKP